MMTKKMTDDERWLDCCARKGRESPDPKTKVGCVIVGAEGSISSEACNTYPNGVLDGIQARREAPLKYIWIEHAERNAIYLAARRGISTEGCTMVVELTPCVECARAMIQGGIAEGVKVPIFRVRDRDNVLLPIDFREIPSVYTYTLMCPQNRIEAILLEKLRALGGDVLRPAEVKGIELSSNGAKLEIETGSVFQKVETAWLIGCDGMHSRVREAAGISFQGAVYQQSFVLADVHMDWPLPPEEVSLFFSPGGLVVVAPLPEARFRIVATVNEASEVPSIEEVQALLDARGPRSSRARIKDCVWTSRFRVHHRIAESPRKGRVLLCGDAAHVHSPAGGQGMNTGIQDAMSLVEVLADVLGGAEESRLDEWAAKRHEIATGVVTLTDRLTRIATMRSPVSRALRNAALVFAGHLTPLTGP